MGDKAGGDSIKDWPEDMRPREKLLNHGEHTLSKAELLAVLLRIGYQGKSAVDLGRIILQKFGSFREMSHTSILEWKEIKGMGEAKISQLRAAIEIGRRFMEEENEIKDGIRSPEDIAKRFMPRMRDLKTEVFKVVLLDGRHNVIEEIEEITEGTPTQAVPHVRDIMTKALNKFATAIVCVHNHPSGNTTPSREDKRFTQALNEACEAMEIKLVDHIIIGDDKFFSFAEAGAI
jgi:DNA repair protein RadC